MNITKFESYNRNQLRVNDVTGDGEPIIGIQPVAGEYVNFIVKTDDLPKLIEALQSCVRED